MTAVLISSTIGLGIGIIVALSMDLCKAKHGVYMAVGIVILFAGIGWGFSHIPKDVEVCAPTEVKVHTPNVRGCMLPEELAELDPEVLGR